MRVLGRPAIGRRRGRRRRRGRSSRLPLVAAVHDRRGHLADPAQPHRRAHPRHAEIAASGRGGSEWNRCSKVSGCSTTGASSRRRGAGPSSADMGADVIRVEKREGGEDRWVQAVTEGGEGGTLPPVQPQQALAHARFDHARGRRDHRPAGGGIRRGHRQHAGGRHAGQRPRLRDPAGGAGPTSSSPAPPRTARAAPTAPASVSTAPAR